MTARPLHPEAGHAVSGAAVMGIGQALAAAIGVGTAILVPRVMGVEDFGWWVLFRGIIQLMASASSVGMGDTVACHYAPRVSAGDVRGADLVFKTMTSARLLSAVVVAGIGAAMLANTAAFPGGTTAALWLALSVALQSAGMSCTQLLYGNRLLFRVAVLHIVQSGVIPVSVAVAYAVGGFGWVPPTAALCDGASAVFAFLLARPVFRWPSGWLPLMEARRILRFGATVGVSSFLIGMTGNAIPYVMAKHEYSAEAMGFVGLGLRLSLLLQSTLLTVSSAAFPTLAMLSAADDPIRAARWLNILSRGGALVMLSVMGGFLALGPSWMGRVFGSEFTRAGPVVAGCFAMLTPLWLGFQATRLLVLRGRAHRMLAAVVVLVIGSLLPLWLVDPDPHGLTVVYVLIAACCLFALTVLLMVPLRKLIAAAWWRLLPAVLWVAGAWAIGRWLDAPGWTLAAYLAWLCGLAAVTLACRVIDGYEIRDLWRALRTSPR